MEPQEHEIYAIKYATRPVRRAGNFIGGDPHDAPMPMDYYVWLIRNAERTVVVDTGFTQETAVARARTYLRSPSEGLRLLGVEAGEVADVILTHLHYDHVGTFHEFPKAMFHLQDAEMAYATGRYMRYERFHHGYSVQDVAGMIRLVYSKRVAFHDGTAEIAPGISVHRMGGHTAGLQCVRVMTRCGWVVLASDASHYYEHMDDYRCFPTCFHVGQAVDSYDKLRRLASSPTLVVPGHDPLVMQRYPAPAPALEGIVVRLDLEPDMSVVDANAPAKVERGHHG